MVGIRGVVDRCVCLPPATNREAPPAAPAAVPVAADRTSTHVITSEVSLVALARAQLTLGSIAEVAPPDAGGAAAPASMRFELAVHVVVNSTRYSSQSSMPTNHAAQSLDAPAPAAAAVASTPAAAEATVEPQAGSRVVLLSRDDFESMRVKAFSRSLESTLSLSLTTLEGDVVEFDFRQLDLMERLRFSGTTEAGERIRLRESSASMERAVSMEITGDLSEEERLAIDALLADVVHVANQFFEGDLGEAMAHLSSLDFDAGTLSEFSLRMSQTANQEMTRAYLGERGVERIAQRDRGAMQVLEFMGDAQHRLIEAAKLRFEESSAVRLVRELLPRLIEVPAGAVGSTVAEGPDTAPVAA